MLRQNATCRMVDDQAMLLDAASQHLITLNASGTLLWQRLDGGATLADLVAALRERWPRVDVDRLRHDAMAFVDELVRLGAVVGEP